MCGYDPGSSLNNLGQLYYSQGDYSKAEQYFKNSLDIKEKALGFNHPDLVTILENLAYVYRATKRDKEARELIKRADKIK